MDVNDELQLMMKTELGRNKLMWLIRKDRLQEIHKEKRIADKLASLNSLGIFKSKIEIKKLKVKSRRLAKFDKTNVKPVEITMETI